MTAPIVVLGIGLIALWLLCGVLEARVNKLKDRLDRLEKYR